MRNFKKLLPIFMAFAVAIAPVAASADGETAVGGESGIIVEQIPSGEIDIQDVEGPQTGEADLGEEDYPQIVMTGFDDEEAVSIADELDMFRDWDFNGALINFIVMQYGFNTVIDNFNLGSDSDCPYRMVNFGYDPETDTYHAFEELDNGFIMRKMKEMGITNMSEVIDWLIEEPLAYLPNPTSMFENPNGGTISNFTLRVTSAAGTQSNSYEVTGGINLGSAYYNESDLSGELTITAKTGFTLKAVNVIASSQDGGANGVIYVKDSSVGDGYRTFYEVISALKHKNSLVPGSWEESSNSVKITAEELKTKYDDFSRSSSEGKIMYEPSVVAGTRTKTSALLLEVVTEPVPLGKVTVSEYGEKTDSRAGFTYGTNTYFIVDRLTAVINSTLANTANSINAGDMLQVSLNDEAEKIVAGVSFDGFPERNKDCTFSNGIIEFPATTNDAKIAIVYKKKVDNFELKVGETTIDAGEFGNYFSHITVDGVNLTGSDNSSDTWNGLLEILKTQFVGDSVNFTFEFSDSTNTIKSASPGTVAVNNKKRVTNVPLNGNNYTVENGIVNGSWDRDTFTPTTSADGNTTLVLTLQSSKPHIAFGKITALDAPSQGPGCGVVALGVLGDGVNSWGAGSEISLSSAITETKNPNKETIPTIERKIVDSTSNKKEYVGVWFTPKNERSFVFGYTGSINVTLQTPGGSTVRTATFEIEQGTSTVSVTPQ